METYAASQCREQARVDGVETCNCPCDGCNPPTRRMSLLDMVWHLTHRAWNRLIHALRGNGKFCIYCNTPSGEEDVCKQCIGRVCAFCGERYHSAVVFSEGNLEVIDDDLAATWIESVDICHKCEFRPVYWQQGDVYYVEEYGWHVILDYIHDDGKTADVMIPSGSERTVPLSKLQLPHVGLHAGSPHADLPATLRRQFEDELAAGESLNNIWHRVSPCCLSLYTNCNVCLCPTCSTCNNSKPTGHWTPPGWRLQNRNGTVSPWSSVLCTCHAAEEL